MLRLVYFFDFHDEPSMSDPNATQQSLATQLDPLMTVDPLESYDPEMHDLLATAIGEEDSPEQLATIAPDENVTAIEDIEIPLATLDETETSAITEVCSRFESAWEEAEEEPSIESFVPPDFDQDLQGQLVQQLVLLDIQNRKKRGKDVSQQQYIAQLPSCRDAVASVFSQIGSNPSKSGQRKSTLPRGYGSVTVPEQKTKPGTNSLHADDESSRYRATKMHARGGLGAVFSARDQELNRVVALKEILPQHSDNPRYQDKFVFEAEVTGSLEHPGIVPVYGLGRYEDNQPYYAMRFIRGHSFRDVIEKFHEENPNPTAGIYFTREFRSLLRRLIETCNAIHFAHEHGVLHRDIKPDNVMLGDFGETLVVDWGLAKLVENDEDNGEFTKLEVRSKVADETQGCAVGTPMYMSPEQAHGRSNQLDRRTDIYALGAVLFNIVSGNYPIEGKSTIDIIMNVRDGKTRELSSIVPAPNALESVCRKAMEKQPSDRYVTAIELAEDIDRWMNDEVPLAHVGHETLSEKAARLIRRYRSWTISGAAALLITTMVAIVAGVLIDGARRNELAAKEATEVQRKEAVARYRESRAAMDKWLAYNDRELVFYPGLQDFRKRILNEAITDFEKLCSEKNDDEELELERCRTIIRLGDVNQMQNDFAQAIEHYNAAIDLSKTSPSDLSLADAFQAEHARAMTRIGVANSRLGNTSEAKQAFSRAIKELTEITDSSQEDYAHKLLANASLAAGELEFEQGTLKAAIDHLQASSQQFETLKVDRETREVGKARAKELLGRIYRQQGQHEQAIVHFNEVIEDLLPLVTANPDNPEFLDALASAQVSEATSFRMRGLDEQTFEALRGAVQSYRALLAARPDVPQYTENLGLTLTDLGIALHEAGQNIEAVNALNESQELLVSMVKTYGMVPRFREQLGACRDGLGQVLTDTSEDAQAAVAMAARSVVTYDELVAEFEVQRSYFERKAVAQSHYARALGRQGDVENAKLHFGGALSTLQQLVEIDGELPSYINDLAHVHYHFGILLHQHGDAEAVEQLTQARNRWQQIESGGTAQHKYDLAWMLLVSPEISLRDSKSALTLLTDAVELAPGNNRYTTALALATLLEGKKQEALRWLDKSQSQTENDRALLIRALALARIDQPSEAKESLVKAEEWWKKHRPFNADSTLLHEFVVESMEDHTK